MQNAKGPIDFNAIKAAGYIGVWLKASQGTTFHDPYFEANVKAALAAGLAVRAYHFYDDKDDAVEQARFFVSILVDGIEGVALDLEWGAGDQSEPALAFFGYVWQQWRAKTLGKVDLYTNLDFINRFSESGKTHLATVAGLWLAYPASSPPPVPPPWTRLDCWQKDWYGRVPGVVGDVDIDVMFG